MQNSIWQWMTQIGDERILHDYWERDKALWIIFLVLFGFVLVFSLLAMLGTADAILIPMLFFAGCFANPYLGIVPLAIITPFPSLFLYLVINVGRVAFSKHCHDSW